MRFSHWFVPLKWFVLFGFIVTLVACGGSGGGSISDGGDDDGGGSGSISTATGSYSLFAWNDLGMHCLNPTYDTLVILPPYNTVWAQLVKRGSPPELVTSGVTLTYAMVNNSTSADKTYPLLGSDYGQFWTYALELFGINLPAEVGLTNNGLSGTMVVSGSHFEIDGIPVTPVDDDNIWSPYQVMEITARDSLGEIIAQTRATVPTSDEINCSKCHGVDAFQDILEEHEPDLSGLTPVLCADCHGSPALGTIGPGSSGRYLSEVIHDSHAHRGASCYDCHPGETTKCSRSLAHTSADGNCEACHGTMQNVADTIVSGRIPWVTEPKCSQCHAGVSEVDTGSILYRNAVGHGGLNCAACHGSPHAMVPSREASDNYQAIQYQGEALSIGSCAVCHSRSRGDGLGEFLEEHGGSRNPSACGVCHTSIDTIDPNFWPHHFEWTNR